MAAKTFFLVPDTDPTGASGTSGPFFSGSLTETDTGAEATTATGWTVAKVAPTVYANIAAAQKRASTAFAAGVLPSGANFIGSDGQATDSSVLVSQLISGTFAAGIWTATMKVIAVTSGGDQDGNLSFRIWKWDGATFASLVDWTSSAIACGTVTNLATATAQNSNGSTASIGPFTLTNERVCLQLAWGITGAGGANTRDVLLRKGTGITLVSPNFTAAAVPRGPAHRTPRVAGPLVSPGAVYL